MVWYRCLPPKSVAIKNYPLKTSIFPLFRAHLFHQGWFALPLFPFPEKRQYKYIFKPIAHSNVNSFSTPSLVHFCSLLWFENLAFVYPSLVSRKSFSLYPSDHFISSLIRHFWYIYIFFSSTSVIRSIFRLLTRLLNRKFVWSGLINK